MAVKVQHALKKSDAALETLNRAIGIDPKNPLCKFHRASILFANDKYKVGHHFHIWKAEILNMSQIMGGFQSSTETAAGQGLEAVSSL